MEGKGFGNVEKIQTWDEPTLVIRAEFDQIIPCSDRQALDDACPSTDKTFLKIPPLKRERKRGNESA